jgi:Double zinc ribbon/Adenylate and Guanylate cyclase catalytic domain
MEIARCGHENQPGARFCGHCGIALFGPTCSATFPAGAKFCSQCGTATVAPELGAQPAHTETRAAPGGEFRHLAVLFCDLVGSTELSARVDAEELRDLLGVYHNACEVEILARGGHVAQYLGDGVLAYFGYPRMHEDNAARAVRAGLGIQAAWARLEAGRGLRLRAQHAIAGSSITAPSALTRNMKASRTPMSAWNLSAESAQVPTPIVMVTAVNTIAVPRSFSAS